MIGGMAPKVRWLRAFRGAGFRREHDQGKAVEGEMYQETEVAEVLAATWKDRRHTEQAQPSRRGCSAVFLRGGRGADEEDAVGRRDTGHESRAKLPPGSSSNSQQTTTHKTTPQSSSNNNNNNNDDQHHHQ